MKDSFILYTKYRKQLKNLSMEQRGVLFTAILCYESGDDLPEMDTIVSIAFDFIREDLDENDRKYEEKCRKNAENGAKGGRPKKATESEKTERFSEKRTQAKKADNDNDNDLNNKECVSSNTNTPSKKKTINKHKYGEYKHVLLTDDEYNKLCTEYGELIISKAIQVVDEYCQTSGKAYKDYNLVLRKWGIDRAKKGDSRGRESPYLEAIRNRVDIVDTWV